MLGMRRRRGLGQVATNPISAFQHGSMDMAHSNRQQMSSLVPMAILDAMEKHGWGNTPREKIPDNWREVDGPELNRGKGGRPRK